MSIRKLIQVGEMLPVFSLPDQNGHDFHVQSLIGQKALVVYFYPKDETLGCTKQACFFRDHFSDFTLYGAHVIGISSDTVQAHAAFYARHQLNFTLLSDVDGGVKRIFGVKPDLAGLLPARVTFVADKDGKVIRVFKSQFRIEKHIHEALSSLAE